MVLGGAPPGTPGPLSESLSFPRWREVSPLVHPMPQVRSRRGLGVLLPPDSLFIRVFSCSLLYELWNQHIQLHLP